MTIRTAPRLPADHGRTTVDHHERAHAMRNTDDWVHIGDYATRQTARNAASQIRCGKYAAYAAHRYDAKPITTADGTHELWGRYIGERSTR